MPRASERGFFSEKAPETIAGSDTGINALLRPGLGLDDSHPAPPSSTMKDVASNVGREQAVHQWTQRGGLFVCPIPALGSGWDRSSRTSSSLPMTPSRGI